MHETLLSASSLPDSEKVLARVQSECRSVVAAGVDTAAWALTHSVYGLLRNQATLDKLLDDIENIDEARPALSTLEKMPLLTGVVLEGLRLSAVSTRLMRIAPASDLVYRPADELQHAKDVKDCVIPAGTSIGMSPMFLNLDSTSFKNPAAFDPERWTNADSPTNIKALMSFGKGTRQCVGMK